MYTEIRDEIEQYIKDSKINRKLFFEVSKQSYGNIQKNIVHHFAGIPEKNSDVHWLNMGHYRKSLLVVYKSSTIGYLDFLPDIISSKEEYLYFLVEGNKNYNHKYWIYEGRLNEILEIINNVVTSDFYIVSKKYKWLISENHHDIWSFVGDGLNLSYLKE